MKEEKEKRRLNKGNTSRFTHILFDTDQDTKFSSFSKYFSKEMDGTLE